jgi:hypothetical protein
VHQHTRTLGHIKTSVNHLFYVVKMPVDKPVDNYALESSLIYTYMPISRYGTYILGLI